METRENRVEETVRPGAADGVGPVAGADDERTGPRKRVIFGTLGAIVAIVLLVWGIKWYLYARVHEGTDDAYVDANPIAVTSKIPERIRAILVSTDQYVKKGQLLIVLDDADERARLRQAEADYALALASHGAETEQSRGGVTQAQATAQAAEAQVPVAQAGVTAARAQLAVAEAQLPAAQQAYDKASADLRRVSALVGTGDLPRQELDAVRAAEAEAAAQLRAAREQVGVAQAQLLSAEQRVDAESAQVRAALGAVVTAEGKLAESSDTSRIAAARAQVELARRQLADTRIYAPADGYIGEKSAEVGQVVGAGITLMTLIPSHDIFITANYKETQVGRMHPGQPVDIHVDAYPGVTFHGHVVAINPASQNTYALVPAQNATGNFVKVTQRIPVKIAVDDMRPDMPLRVGMSVETYVKVR